MKNLVANRFRLHSVILSLSILILSSSFISPMAGVSTYSREYFQTSQFLSMTNPFVGTRALNSFYLSKMEVYDSLKLQYAGLSREAFEWGLLGMEKLIYSGQTLKDNLLSIIDFTQPSYNKRLYVIDLTNYQLLFNTWVAHGKNSGIEMAESFSNNQSSNKSSLGLYLTGATYRGRHGYSLRLTGMEKGINDNAANRAIVVHAAKYVNQSLINRAGYIGRSQGCPAVSPAVARPIIDHIKEGSCLFIYYPSSKYIGSSELLN